MSPVYNNGSEAIETVYTYEEWLKEYNRREKQRKIRQRTEHLYYIRQRLSGLFVAAIGIIAPFILDGDITVSLLALPLGIFLLLTKERVMTFYPPLNLSYAVFSSNKFKLFPSNK